MEAWFIFLITISISVLTKILFNLLFSTKISSHKLPPGPPKFPVIGSLLWLTTSLYNLHLAISSLHSKFGPILTLYIGSLPAVFIADRRLAHQALVQNGAIFADRPPARGIEKINTSNQHTISSASYGSTWRFLRRNLASEILHPLRVKSYSHSRKWVLQLLKDRLESEFRGSGRICVMNHLQYAMFCLLAVMCLGDKVSEDNIEKIEVAHRRFLSNFVGFNIFSFCPSVTKVVFRNLWKKYLQIRRDQENALIPLIRARKELKERRLSEIKEGEFVLCYVDSLIDLQLPVEKRKLEEGEIVSLCSEFLSGGAETTTTALQWIMANLVKYPQIQEKLFREIKEVVGEGEELIKEEDLQKMPYLKAVILEGLRRHPPAHMVVPHVVTEDTVIDKYLVPKNGTINFMVAEMGRDPKVWEDPMEFKPERFMSCDGEMVDVTGIKEIKMMPFGSGRRICPGYSLAMFHLEYFVANLVWSYEWKKLKGDEVDLSEQLEFSVGMKYPLQACISPRSIQMSTTSSVPDGFIFNKLHLS